MDNLDVLALAAGDSRILVSHDVHTMPAHFVNFMEVQGQSPGVFLISQEVAIGEAIEQVVLIWSATDARVWSGRLVWLPL